MNDMELAEEIEKQLKGCDNDTLAWPSVALTPDEWQQIIAALRRGHEPLSADRLRELTELACGELSSLPTESEYELVERMVKKIWAEASKEAK